MSRTVEKCVEAVSRWCRLTLVSMVSTRVDPCRPVITLTFVRGGGEVVFKNTYESLSVDGVIGPLLPGGGATLRTLTSLGGGV